VVYELTELGRGLAPVLAALADWGMNLLGEPRDDDEVRSSWLVLGLAATAKAAVPVPDGTYELRVGDETFNVRSRDGHLQAANGPAPNPEATITLTAETLAAIGGGELRVPSRQADRLIAIEGDAAGARRLLESLAR
jgi:alkyl sulfatase BDS1-like metallo-beta-lactamase superfamily hydrolase